jgi:4-hydroxybenzoate polyprenyltransferase
LFATSNIADVKDIEEDRYNNINTLPVQYGELTTSYVILISLALSSFLFGIHHNYTVRPLINSMFELQNAGVSFVPFLQVVNNETNA